MPSSPFQAVAEAAGAVWTEAVDFRIPAHFGDPAHEYSTAVESATLFDLSHTAKLEITGPDAPQFLHNISTQDVANLPLGGGCELYFCDARAKALFAAWVYHVRLADQQHALWLETTPGRGPALLKHLDRFLIAESVELIDATTRFAQLHLAGPHALAVLAAAVGSPIPALGEFQHMERSFGPATASIRCRNRLGLPGYDIVCLNARAETLWKQLTAAGARPAGAEAFEVLRIEAGTPIYGVDIDETRFVMEIGHATRAVSYSKGCFPGQEPIVMARDRAGRVNRAFLGLKILSDHVPAAGAKLVKDDQEVGIITSATRSPRLGAPLALGYVHWKSTDTGTRLTVETESESFPAEVLGYPPLAQ
ncbi:MAG: hypothetical protein LC104_20205 [Bacteroidales bacterium]|nr:hypothetical protein [Bacteroidales bacterium]